MHTIAKRCKTRRNKVIEPDQSPVGFVRIDEYEITVHADRYFAVGPD